MTQLALSLACTASDRTRPLLDGRIRIPGVDIVPLPGEPEEIFRRALRDRAFDITELSMGSHITTTARGDSAYVGVPVFPSRAFRHSGIFIRADGGIRAPEDLAGRRIGLPEYQQTAAMWVRGILSDHHGVGPEDVEWVVGSQEAAGGTERVRIDLPDRIRLRRLGPQETLNDLLESGRIDAIVTPRPPSSFLRGDGRVVRLFPDYRAVETEFHRRTGFFPIMHCVAVRRSLAEAHPWLPFEVYRAFAAAKDMAMDDLQRSNFLRASLPWVAAHYEETRALMGDDIWPYGLPRNREEIATMIRYASDGGLIRTLIEPDDLFHPSVLDA